MEEMKVRLTFQEEVLGTASSDKEVHRTYIASKAPDAKKSRRKLSNLVLMLSKKKA